jgi:hypothetical protein
MSEAEITEQMVMMMDLTLFGVSVFFSIVSAYIVALFYFLNRAPFGLKVTAFAFFTLTMLFLAVFAAGSFSHAAALQRALIDLAARTEVSPVAGAAAERGVVDRTALDRTIRSLTWMSMGLVYLALTYFTFFHRWPRPRGADKTG